MTTAPKVGERVRLAIRGYKGKTRVFEHHVDLPEKDLDKLIPCLAEKHAKLLADSPHTIEIEFLDEPNPLERFFRFGTDSTGMVIPASWARGGLGRSG